MSITGNLETMNLAELLQWLANNRQTGTLTISNGTIEKRIYLQGGTILSSSSSDPPRLLGHFLVSKGVINEDDLALAMVVQEREGKLLGEILVESGAVERSTLARMLRLNAEENICDLFAWQEGSFEFHDGELPNHELVSLSSNITGLIMEGMRRIDHTAVMKEVIPSPQCVPVAVVPLFDDDELDPGWRGVLEAVDDDRSIEDICLHTHSSEFFVCQVLHRKIVDGKLKIVRPRVIEPERDIVVETVVSSGVVPQGEALIGEAMKQMAAGAYESAVRHLRAAASLEPDNQDLRLVIEQKESQIRSGIAKAGVRPDRVPVFESSLDEMKTLRLTPGEGFILSRINGKSNIRSIAKISPLSEIEALLVFWKLVEAKHISFLGDE
jgi:hypothetical protein